MMHSFKDWVSMGQTNRTEASDLKAGPSGWCSPSAVELCRPCWGTICCTSVQWEERGRKCSPAVVGHFSPAADGSMGKKNSRVPGIGKLSPAVSQRWMNSLSCLGKRPAESLWGESSLLHAFWQPLSKLPPGLWCKHCTISQPLWVFKAQWLMTQSSDSASSTF